MLVSAYLSEEYFYFVAPDEARRLAFQHCGVWLLEHQTLIHVPSTNEC